MLSCILTVREETCSIKKKLINSVSMWEQMSFCPATKLLFGTGTGKYFLWSYYIVPALVLVVMHTEVL